MAAVTCAWGCTAFAPDDRDCAEYGLGAMALRYAWMGYAVLPLRRGGKQPHQMLGNRGGVHRATKDPDGIRELWSLDMAANVGVATGAVSRLAVADLDVKHGVSGTRHLARFMQENRIPHGIWDAPRVLTPSGGHHLWLRVPAGAAVPERPGILPGVDVKGDGGYVVAAPSALAVQPLDRPGERGAGSVPVPYEWAAGCPHGAPLWPGWMAGWLESAVASGTRQPGHDGSGVPSELVPGGRNRGMYRLACSLYRKQGTGSGAVLAELRAVWEKTDKSGGFSWQEVLTCAESARRFIGHAAAAEDTRNRQFLDWLNRRG